mmetsp:Transcript_35/g.67  ORF Transcript_35/g.67 Transcript_35/m.67 type:complete len:225 (-) Transcript_35:604-1278(-)
MDTVSFSFPLQELPSVLLLLILYASKIPPLVTCTSAVDGGRHGLVSSAATFMPARPRFIWMRNVLAWKSTCPPTALNAGPNDIASGFADTWFVYTTATLCSSAIFFKRIRNVFRRCWRSASSPRPLNSVRNRLMMESTTIVRTCSCVQMAPICRASSSSCCVVYGRAYMTFSSTDCLSSCQRSSAISPMRVSTADPSVSTQMTFPAFQLGSPSAGGSMDAAAMV